MLVPFRRGEFLGETITIDTENFELDFKINNGVRISPSTSLDVFIRGRKIYSMVWTIHSGGIRHWIVTPHLDNHSSFAIYKMLSLDEMKVKIKEIFKNYLETSIQTK